MSYPFKYTGVLRPHSASQSWADCSYSNFHIAEETEDDFPSQFEFFSAHAEAAETDQKAIKILLSLGALFNSVQKIRNSPWRLIFDRFYKYELSGVRPIHDVILTLQDDEYYWPFLAQSTAPSSDLAVEDYILTRAINDEVLLKILRLLQREANWDDLYRIYELLKQHNEPAIEKHSIKSDRTRFTRTANHPVAARDQARHGTSNDQPPPNPMTLLEAEAFILQLIKVVFQF